MDSVVEKKIEAQRAQITEKIVVASDVFLVRFVVSDNRPFVFQPGQHVVLCLPSTDGTIERPFSIASAPNASGSFELLVQLRATGVASDFFRSVTPGASVLFHGPHGSFVVRDPSCPTHLIASRSGLAPFRSMLPSLLSDASGGSSARSVRLSFIREPDGWELLDHELQAWAERCKNFTVQTIPSSSDPDAPPDWECVPITDPHGEHVYVCGGPPFVSGIKTMLAGRGYAPEKIFSEY